MTKILLFYVMAFLVTCHSHAQSHTLRVAWDDYPPYQMASGGDVQGIDIEFVRTLAEVTGYKLTLVKMPWARQLLSLENGSIDIAMSASISDDRAAYAVWTDEYRPERAALMTLASNAKAVSSLSALVGTSALIGVIRDSSFPGEYETLIKDIEFRRHVHFTGTNITALKMMRAARISHLLDDPVAIDYLVKLDSGPKVSTVLMVMDSKAHLMVSKKTVARLPGLMSELNKGISRLQRQGILSQIFSRYGTSLN